MVRYPSSLQMKKDALSACLRFFGGVMWWGEKQAKLKRTLLSGFFKLRKNCKYLGKIDIEPCKMQVKYLVWGREERRSCTIYSVLSYSNNAGITARKSAGCNYIVTTWQPQ